MVTGVDPINELAEPQHWTDPPARTAQLCLVPVLMAVAVEMPETGAGTLVAVVGPFPSSPWWLSPQHRRVLLESRAQVWFAPAPTAVAVVIPDTATGDSPGSSVPLPG